MKNENFKQELIAWRHNLHAHPESAFEEENTARFVAEKLLEMGYEVATGIGKTGVVGTLENGTGSGIIGIRADMDALNIHAKTDLPFASEYPGKMHACGHEEDHIIVEIELSNGEREFFSASAVILALPPRIVKEHIVFSPSLSDNLISEMINKPT